MVHECLEHIHPGRLTWNLRIHTWKRKIIFQTIIFRFYVDLPGCICDIPLEKKNLNNLITSAGKRQLIICATLLHVAWLTSTLEALGLSIWNHQWLLRFAWMCDVFQQKCATNLANDLPCCGPHGTTMKHRRHDQICTSKDRFGTSTGRQGWNVEDH